jgi:hypothetical protein
LIDVLLNFNTGYWDKGILIMKRANITKHYLKTWFIFDIIATFPYENVTSYVERKYITGKITNNISILDFIVVFRLIRVIKLEKL